MEVVVRHPIPGICSRGPCIDIAANIWVVAGCVISRVTMHCSLLATWIHVAATHLERKQDKIPYMIPVPFRTGDNTKTDEFWKSY